MGMQVVATSECVVPGCPFVAIGDDATENPYNAAKQVADHLNEAHDVDEVPESVFND